MLYELLIFTIIFLVAILGTEMLLQHFVIRNYEFTVDSKKELHKYNKVILLFTATVYPLYCIYIVISMWS